MGVQKVYESAVMPFIHFRFCSLIGEMNWPVDPSLPIRQYELFVAVQYVKSTLIYYNINYYYSLPFPLYVVRHKSRMIWFTSFIFSA